MEQRRHHDQSGRSGRSSRSGRSGQDDRRRLNGRRPPAGFVPFRTPVRGYRFAARPPGAGHPRPGQRAGLVREQAHPVDPWATSVWLRSDDGTPWRIGYLERAVAARLGPRLDRGEPVRAEIAGWETERSRPWRRPVLVVEPEAFRGSGATTASSRSGATTASSRGEDTTASG